MYENPHIALDKTILVLKPGLLVTQYTLVFYIWWLMRILDLSLWQLFLDYLLERNRQSYVQRFSAVYQSLEPYDEEVDFFGVPLFQAHQISLQAEIFRQMLEQ
jgi:hypothetical protein